MMTANAGVLGLDAPYCAFDLELKNEIVVIVVIQCRVSRPNMHDL